MKTQMQIVQEAIARLESMSREEFRATLIKAGAVEAHAFFTKTVSGFDAVEQSDPVREKKSDYRVVSKKRGLNSEMSLVF